ncbi:MAG: acyltransferase [Hyphomicrobiaceae bacterium]|nr:acyltransferase [Hyphomicrobiaceae bacterium]
MALIAQASSGSPAQIDAVDALRGFAIALVVMVHAQLVVVPAPGFLAGMADLGARGVQLFYVVSAYTLYRSLAHRWHAGEDHLIGRYFIRRFFRIAPMFYLVVAFNLATLGFAPRHWAPGGIGWLDLLATVTFANAWVPNAITSAVDGGWSIAIEWNFYLLLPLLVVPLRTGRRALAFALGAGLAGYGLSGILSQWLTPAGAADAHVVAGFFKFWLPYQLIAFGAGIVLFHAPDIFAGDESRARWLAPSLLLVSIAVFFFVGKWFPLKVAALALFAYVVLHRPAALLVNPATIWLGRLSYSVYFLHFLVLRYAAAPLASLLEGLPTAVAFWIGYLAVLAGSSALAYVTWRAVERPGMALGAMLARRLR